MLVHKWHRKADELVSEYSREAFPFLPAGYELPLLRNDHDLTLDQPLVRVDSSEQMEIVQAARTAFERECRRDPDDDLLGIGGDDFEQNFSGRCKNYRACRLCPKDHFLRVSR